MRKAFENTGFTPRPERRNSAIAALVASLALALATIVVATVVSTGIARADVGGGVIGNEGSIFAVALLLGLAFIGISGLTLSGGRPKKH